MRPRWLLVALAAALTPAAAAAQDKPTTLRFATDTTGGGPYAYQPPGSAAGDPYIGFEVELADYLAKKLGRERGEVVRGTWNKLPELLDQKRADIVLNGYEERDDLKKDYAATVPYYVYRLQLVAHKDNTTITSWADLKPKGGKPGKKIGVLEGSVAFDYCSKRFPGQVESNEDVGTVFGRVADRQMDATVQDNPACVHYVETDPAYKGKLRLVGESRQPGYYVIYLRRDDKGLLDGINTAIKEGLGDGSLRAIYKKYGIWNADQEWLCKDLTGEFPPDEGEEEVARVGTGGADSVWRLLPELLRAAGVTVLLSVASFPLAMAAGVAIGVVRVYGPRWASIPLGVYVEVIRGTPLLLQLYVIFYMLPKLDDALALEPIYAGILGLAINYSAYEAENYRAGLLAIPRGQMEAALALGMNPFTAIRVVIVPQALRIVIPPVTNDFIALFKDTSVCSVILITELTRRYNELYNFNRNLVTELAFLTAGLYLLMSYPLSILARYLERRMGTHGGGAHR